MKQYGIKLVDSKEPIWIFGNWDNHKEIVGYIKKNSPLVTFCLVGRDNREVTVNTAAIQMISGPNDGSIMSEVYK